MIDAMGFNPRSPCGERQLPQSSVGAPAMFQPTLPLRGATFRLFLSGRQFQVSTHAPLAGSDLAHVDLRLLDVVSTHAPLAGSDLQPFEHVGPVAVSTHAPLAGSDRIS